MISEPIPMLSNPKQFNLGIAVFSSDAYSDFWGIFFDAWFKYSGFDEFPIYLITATKSFQDKRVVVVNTPEFASHPWSDRIKAGLIQIPHDYLLVVTEDLLCFKSKNNTKFDRLIRFIQAADCTCLHLVPDTSLHLQSNEMEIGKIFDWSMHRVSLQMSIWKREALIRLMREGESPWQFEINGTQRSRSDDNYFSTVDSAVSYLEVIGKGKITRRGMKLMRSMGIVNINARPIFSRKEELFRNIGHLKARLFYSLPTFIQKCLIKGGVVGRDFDNFNQQKPIWKD